MTKARMTRNPDGPRPQHGTAHASEDRFAVSTFYWQRHLDRPAFVSLIAVAGGSDNGPLSLPPVIAFVPLVELAHWRNRTAVRVRPGRHIG